MSVKVKKRNGDWWGCSSTTRAAARPRRSATRKAAELAVTKIRARLADGDLTPFEEQRTGTAFTFKSYAEEWLKNTVKQTCKFSTTRIHQTNLGLHAYPVFGPKPLAAVSRADCRALIAACREKGLSPKTIENISRTVSSVMTQAVEDELLPANPAFRLGRHIRQGDRASPEIRPFTRDEASAFLKKALEHAPRGIRCS